MFKASARGILDHKAFLIGRVHLVKEERDQLDFHVAKLALSNRSFLEWIHDTSLGMYFIVIYVLVFH